jgi:DNA-binding MarR family transcriptional regulator
MPPVGYKTLLSDETVQAAKALRLALEPLVKENPTIPASYVISLLAVAEKEGQPVSAYAKQVGIQKAVMTRHLLDLGERDRHGDEGMKLVERKQDTKDLRIWRQFITEKGASLLSKMRHAWEKGERMASVNDVNGQPVKIGDLVRQVLYDDGTSIPDIHRRGPRRVEAIGSARGEIVLEGSLQWQSAGQFEKVESHTGN